MSNHTGGGAGHDFVRPFIMTGGRTRSRTLDLRLETLVHRVASAPVTPAMPSEKVHLVNCCASPTSVAEISAQLDLVVGVVKVLVEDLVETGHVQVFTEQVETVDEELDMLTRISNKIRSL